MIFKPHSYHFLCELKSFPNLSQVLSPLHYNPPVLWSLPFWSQHVKSRILAVLMVIIWNALISLRAINFICNYSLTWKHCWASCRLYGLSCINATYVNCLFHIWVVLFHTSINKDIQWHEAYATSELLTTSGEKTYLGKIHFSATQLSYVFFNTT